MKRILFLVSCLLCLSYGYSQQDSCNLRISILTCGPGEDLYSVFGHTAVRVTDQQSRTDIIYNYGTFDFSDPDFYIKFVRGKLLYFVSAEQYTDFMYEYHLDNRSVIEQELHISCAEKENLSAALKTNAREENKYYFYEFLFDNCSTRVRDIVKRNLRDSVHFKNIIPQPVPTFRNMLHVCLDDGKLYWSKLGIDLALGSLIDRAPTNEEAMFLPGYLMKGFDSASIRGMALVNAKKALLTHSQAKDDGPALFTPLKTMTGLLVIICIVMFSGRKPAHRFLSIFDTVLFFVIGGVGCFLVFMWVGTEHDLTAKNYNLLWALPTHLFVSFFLSKRKKWISAYFAFSAIFYLVVIVCWHWIPQGMNPAFLPLSILLGVRSFARAKKKIDG